MSSLTDKIYTFEIDKLDYLFAENAIDDKDKYAYDKLKLWTFKAEKFTINFLAFNENSDKGYSNDVIIQFGESELLESLLEAKGVERETFTVESWKRTKGFLKYVLVQLNDGVKLRIGGGRGGPVLYDERENKNQIEISSYDEAFDDNPFLKFQKNPVLSGEVELSETQAVEEFKDKFKGNRRAAMGWGVLGCLGSSVLWLIGTLIVVAIVIYVVAKIMG